MVDIAYDLNLMKPHIFYTTKTIQGIIDDLTSKYKISCEVVMSSDDDCPEHVIDERMASAAFLPIFLVLLL